MVPFMFSVSFNSDRKVTRKEQNKLFTLAPFLCIKQTKLKTDHHRPKSISGSKFPGRKPSSSRLLPKGIVSPNTPLPCFHNHSHLTTLLPLDFPWTQAAKTIFQITSHKGFILQLQYFPSFSFCKSITTLFFLMPTLHGYLQVNLQRIDTNISSSKFFNSQYSCLYFPLILKWTCLHFVSLIFNSFTCF